MKNKLICLILAAVMVLTLGGCSEVSRIAGSVADAAKQELENQVRQTLDKYKLEVVEVKTAAGKLNGEADTVQFFCAALVKAGSDSLPQTCADALSKLFEDAGCNPQATGQVENQYLQHKEVSFDHTDFAGEGYYTIWVYNSVLEKTK